MQLITRMLSKMPVGGSRACVLTSPGDRPDAQIELLGATASAHFDRFYLCPEDDLRGRQPHEIPALLQRGILQSRKSGARIHCLESEQAAIDAALRDSGEGDFVAVFVAGLDSARKQIESLASERQITRERVSEGV
jgi:cyanophycin synthetase